MTCCFLDAKTRHLISHINCPLLYRLVEEIKIDLFWVGNEGGFDRMVASALAEIKKSPPTFFVKGFGRENVGSPFSS